MARIAYVNKSIYFREGNYAMHAFMASEFTIRVAFVLKSLNTVDWPQIGLNMPFYFKQKLLQIGIRHAQT